MSQRAEFFSKKISTPSMASLARAVSLIHPDHKELYGSFLFSLQESSYREILKYASFNFKDLGKDVVFAYYPHLLGDIPDLNMLLDLLQRGDFNEPCIIFYTNQLPEIDHEQCPGVHVLWQRGSSAGDKLDIVVALKNESGEIEINDSLLVDTFKSQMIASVNLIEKLKDSAYMMKYIEYVFQELDEAKRVYNTTKSEGL